jgi:hypothetical protein
MDRYANEQHAWRLPTHLLAHDVSLAALGIGCGNDAIRRLVCVPVHLSHLSKLQNAAPPLPHQLCPGGALALLFDQRADH